MGNIAPKEPFAAVTRKALEDHTEWDSPHCFMIFCWVDGALVCRTYTVVMPDINPADYPALMARQVTEDRMKNPGDEPCACLLQTEVWSTTEPGPGATDEERAQFLADRLGRTFHQRADAVEKAVAMCADTYGRFWYADKRRDRPEVIWERFYPPGKALRGRLVEGLLDAIGTGLEARNG